MEFEKHVLATMPKCYAIGMFEGADAASFVAGVEKEGPIRRFSLEGEPMETVAEGPGGVMTIAQMPGRDDQLLATSEFFSPNFGADTAKVVAHTRAGDGTWSTTTLCELPYVHRFGVLLGADGTPWLIACTIKGACEHGVKDDWRVPGSVWVAPIERPCEAYGEAGGLELSELRASQVQNHGFWVAPDASHALVSTAAGVFRYTPPKTAAEGTDGWEVTCLIVQPTSDICVCDLDGDGLDEILTISAFHGDTLAVWHETAVVDRYERVWVDPVKRPFLHAIWGGSLCGQPCAVVGNRKGRRELLRVYRDYLDYRVEVIDEGAGPANCWVFAGPEGDRIVAANRETDELALYTPASEA